MNVSKKKLFAYSLLLVIVASACTVAAESALLYFHQDPRVKANVYVFKDGLLVGSACGNLITTIGENQSLYAHIGNAMNLAYISMGNCTPATGLTQITNEAAENGFTRASCSQSAVWSNGGHYAINFTTTFTGVTAMETVSSAGLNWASSGNNNLYAVAYLTDGTAQQFPVGSTCTVTWVLTFNEHP